jgi:cbb3-type cytochrome oxidase subunit 3
MRRKFLTLASLAVIFYACEPGRKAQTEEADPESVFVEGQDREGAAIKGNISITPFSSSPEFGDAVLMMNAPEDGARVKPGKVRFNYHIENYELGRQTPDAEHKNCANSEQGQHIHLILNNAPYTAHYQTEFERELEPGHYVALSFLSRSYHESLKHDDAFVLKQFTVGDGPKQEVDLSAPHLFYSRPKGEYQGQEEIEKILLDFYLVNTELSEEGNKVRATINGKEFIINEWKPFAVRGLPMGESTFKLELIDNQGNAIPGPFNVVERTITLKP